MPKIFKPGDYVIYVPTTPQGLVYRVEYGIVKRMNNDNSGAFVWYHSGCTAANTPSEFLLLSDRLPEHQNVMKDVWSAYEEN